TADAAVVPVVAAGVPEDRAVGPPEPAVAALPGADDRRRLVPAFRRAAGPQGDVGDRRRVDRTGELARPAAGGGRGRRPGHGADGVLRVPHAGVFQLFLPVSVPVAARVRGDVVEKRRPRLRFARTRTVNGVARKVTAVSVAVRPALA